MPFNLTPQEATAPHDFARETSSPVRRGWIARWLIGLTLVTGLGIGVASIQATSSHVTNSHATTSHLTANLTADDYSNGVTGGPGNG